MVQNSHPTPNLPFLATLLRLPALVQHQHLLQAHIDYYNSSRSRLYFTVHDRELQDLDSPSAVSEDDVTRFEI